MLHFTILLCRYVILFIIHSLNIWSDLDVFTGDEILCVNDESVNGMTHAQAINCFKKVRRGALEMKICRRKIIQDNK